jgi:hypothetical protein
MIGMKIVMIMKQVMTVMSTPLNLQGESVLLLLTGKIRVKTKDFRRALGTKRIEQACFFECEEHCIM